MNRTTSRTEPSAGLRRPYGQVITRSMMHVLFGILALGPMRSAAQSIQPPEITSRDYVTNLQMRFLSQSNIVYRIMCRTNLTTGSWTAIRAGIADTTQTDVELNTSAKCYYRVLATTLHPIPSSSETWYRSSSNPDYGLRIRGYIIVYPQVIEVALEMIDLTTGDWKQVVTTASLSTRFTVLPRDVSPDNQVVVHGHDNGQGHPYAEYYLYIHKVASPNQKVIVTIPEALESVRFNEDKTITVNGQYTYTRDGQLRP